MWIMWMGEGAQVEIPLQYHLALLLAVLLSIYSYNLYVSLPGKVAGSLKSLRSQKIKLNFKLVTQTVGHQELTDRPSSSLSTHLLTYLVLAQIKVV